MLFTCGTATGPAVAFVLILMSLALPNLPSAGRTTPADAGMMKETRDEAGKEEATMAVTRPVAGSQEHEPKACVREATGDAREELPPKPMRCRKTASPETRGLLRVRPTVMLTGRT